MLWLEREGEGVTSQPRTCSRVLCSLPQPAIAAMPALTSDAGFLTLSFSSISKHPPNEYFQTKNSHILMLRSMNLSSACNSLEIKHLTIHCPCKDETRGGKYKDLSLGASMYLWRSWESWIQFEIMMTWVTCKHLSPFLSTLLRCEGRRRTLIFAKRPAIC